MRVHELAKELGMISKDLIEQETGAPCRHFSAPWGKPGVDYEPVVHPPLAKRTGYSSFVTTQRGPNRSGSDPYQLRRDHLMANWEDYHLRYWLSRG